MLSRVKKFSSMISKGWQVCTMYVLLLHAFIVYVKFVKGSDEAQGLIKRKIIDKKIRVPYLKGRKSEPL